MKETCCADSLFFNLYSTIALSRLTITNLSRMHDERNVAVSRGRERPERSDDCVLSVVAVAVAVLAQAQHELHVVHHDVRDVMHVASVLYRLHSSEKTFRFINIKGDLPKKFRRTKH